MFNNKSIYARNKLDKDAIVYPDATGRLIRLTRADFSCEAEFQQWKSWSDGDYMMTEKDGRGFDDNVISLELLSEEAVICQSAGDEAFERQAAAEHEASRRLLRDESQRCLTETQYRRLWMFYEDGMSELEIAAAEGVTQQSVSDTITGARKKLKKLSKNYL